MSIIGQAIKHVAIVVAEPASDALQAYRYNTCLSCSKFIHKTKQCRICFCFMEAKTALKNQHCDLNKW